MEIHSGQGTGFVVRVTSLSREKLAGGPNQATDSPLLDFAIAKSQASGPRLLGRSQTFSEADGRVP